MQAKKQNRSAPCLKTIISPRCDIGPSPGAPGPPRTQVVRHFDAHDDTSLPFSPRSLLERDAPPAASLSAARKLPGTFSMTSSCSPGGAARRSAAAEGKGQASVEAANTDAHAATAAERSICVGTDVAAPAGRPGEQQHACTCARRACQPRSTCALRRLSAQPRSNAPVARAEHIEPYSFPTLTPTALWPSTSSKQSSELGQRTRDLMLGGQALVLPLNLTC